MAASILVVEDEKLVALDICRSLSRRGYSVIGPASSSEEALDLALKSKPNIVLMDINIQGAFDGVTAAAQIRDLTNVPVIFLTAHADSITLERAKVTEPAGYVLKPFDDVALHATLEMALYKSEQNARIYPEPGTPHGVNGRGADGASRGSAGPADEAQSDPKTFLRSIDFFARLDDFDLTMLAQTCSFKQLQAGEVLAIQGAESTPSFLVCTGRICMIKTTELDRELIVAIVAPGDLYGLTAAVSNRPSPLTIRADKFSRLLLVPKTAFRLLLQSRPEAALRLSQSLADQLDSANNLARALAHDNVVTRVVSLLNALIIQIGFIENGVSVVDITRQELADLAGTTVETVVRVLKLLERNSILKSGRRKRIQIGDVPKLQSFVRKTGAEDRGMKLTDVVGGS